MKFNIKRLLLILFLFLPLITTTISLFFLPDLIPAHYGFDGIVTRWGSKYEALIIPIIGAVVSLMILIITTNAAKHSESKDNMKALNATNIFLAITFNILNIIFLISSFNQLTN